MKKNCELAAYLQDIIDIILKPKILEQEKVIKEYKKHCKALEKLIKDLEQ